MMKKPIKNIEGVTLLEIMLVLAIASMVIVMSIRYYQNATNAQNTNVVMEEIQNLTAAADNLAQGSGSYSQFGGSAQVIAVAGASNLKTPFATTITTSGFGPNGYAVTVPLGTTSGSSAVCAAVAAKLASNKKYTAATCNNGTVTYTYNATS